MRSSDANPYTPVAEAKEEEVEETMQDLFAKFMKAEREAGAGVDEMKSMIDEGTAEYEYADLHLKRLPLQLIQWNKWCVRAACLKRKLHKQVVILRCTCRHA